MACPVVIADPKEERRFEMARIDPSVGSALRSLLYSYRGGYFLPAGKKLNQLFLQGLQLVETDAQTAQELVSREYAYYIGEYGKQTRLFSLLQRTLCAGFDYSGRIVRFALRPLSNRPNQSGLLHKLLRRISPSPRLIRLSQPGVARIRAFDLPDDTFSSGSATVITSDGFLLTNFHILYNHETDSLYQQIEVSLSDNPGVCPKARYRAKVAFYDRALDIAVVQCVRDADDQRLTKPLRLPYVHIGDSGSILLADELYALGYPEVGRGTLHLTSGKVSGFAEGMIKTDASFGFGSSGGAALNARGELIGVPTQIYVTAQAKTNLVLPINTAKPLLQRLGLLR